MGEGWIPSIKDYPEVVETAKRAFKTPQVSTPPIPKEKKSKKKKQKKTVSTPDLTAITKSPSFIKSASTPFGQSYYRLTLEEVPKEEFAKDLLLSIDLRDMRSLFSIGKAEEDIYRHVSREMANYSFSQKDDQKQRQKTLNDIVSLVLKGKWEKARKLTNCSSLKSYLDITKNDFDVAVKTLNTLFESYQSLKAISLAGHSRLVTITDALGVGVKLFKKKVPDTEKVLLNGICERLNALETLCQDYKTQSTQIEVTLTNVSQETFSLNESITGLLSQLHQLLAQETYEEKPEPEQKETWSPASSFLGGWFKSF